MSFHIYLHSLHEDDRQQKKGTPEEFSGSHDIEGVGGPSVFAVRRIANLRLLVVIDSGSW